MSTSLTSKAPLDSKTKACHSGHRFFEPIRLSLDDLHIKKGQHMWCDKCGEGVPMLATPEDPNICVCVECQRSLFMDLAEPLPAVPLSRAFEHYQIPTSGTKSDSAYDELQQRIVLYDKGHQTPIPRYWNSIVPIICQSVRSLARHVVE